MSLSLTYTISEVDCLRSASRDSWLQTIKNSMQESAKAPKQRNFQLDDRREARESKNIQVDVNLVN
jgi:hypothetical protein